MMLFINLEMAFYTINKKQLVKAMKGERNRPQKRERQ